MAMNNVLLYYGTKHDPAISDSLKAKSIPAYQVLVSDQLEIRPDPI